MKKKNVLFITRGLQKAGAEKYLFELISNIDKKKFNCEVLTFREVSDHSDFPHYYYHKLLELDIKVHTILDFPYVKRDRFNSDLLRKFSNKVINFLNKIFYPLYKKSHFKKIKTLIDNQDWIAVIDIFNYSSIIKHILDEKNNFDIHLMCHKAQFNTDIYENLESDKAYRFTYIDKLQLDEVLESKKKIKSAIGFPLSLDVSKAYNINANLDSEEILRIGIFTRINTIKPIDDCISAFKVVLDNIANAELHIFGYLQDIDYYESLISLISSNELNDKVIFHGHADDMITSIKKNHINLIWMLSINNFVGYASIEIGLYAMPILLLNLEKKANRLNDGNDVIKFFRSDKDLATATVNLIQKGNISKFGSDIRSMMVESHDIRKNILDYETSLCLVLDTINA